MDDNMPLFSQASSSSSTSSSRPCVPPSSSYPPHLPSRDIQLLHIPDLPRPRCMTFRGLETSPLFVHSETNVFGLNDFLQQEDRSEKNFWKQSSSSSATPVCPKHQLWEHKSHAWLMHEKKINAHIMNSCYSPLRNYEFIWFIKAKLLLPKLIFISMSW